MILFFTLISIIAAALGIYIMLGTEWARLDAYERIDAVNACYFLAVVVTAALLVSFVWAPFR